MFTLPEQTLGEIHQEMDGGRGSDSFKVLAVDRDNTTTLGEGSLAVIGNEIDPTTGTIKLKATFPNQDLRLWPGQFVNAHLVLDVVHNGVTVPAAAVQTGPKGRFVYVVRSDSTVDLRTVTVTQTENNRSLIGAGVSAGERVVTAGWYRLTPGAKVSVSEDNNPAGAPATVGAAGAAAR